MTDPARCIRVGHIKSSYDLIQGLFLDSRGHSVFGCGYGNIGLDVRRASKHSEGSTGSRRSIVRRLKKSLYSRAISTLA